MRRETVPDSRSSSTKGKGAKDKLYRATDKTLAEADRGYSSAWIVPMKQAGELWRIAGV